MRKMWVFLFVFMAYSISMGILQSVEIETTRRSPKLEQRVVNGYNCTLAEYSHLANILYKEAQFCGGSLITSTWMVTAAHCCTKMKNNPTQYSVIFGMRVWNQTYEQKSMIAQVHIHKDYRSDRWINDICLVKLEDEIRTNEKVKITKLATKQEYRDLLNKKGWIRVTVVGFGVQKPRTRGRPNPHVQCARLYVAGPNGACLIEKNSTFCASDPVRRERSSCFGDSGGPLFCDGIQIGLVSTTFGCGPSGFPGYYTRVDIYKDFIDGLVEGSFREGVDDLFSESSRVTHLSCAQILLLLSIVYAIYQ